MIVDPSVERYIDGLLPPRDEVLAEMEEFAAARRIPIVGPAVGRLLAQLVMMSGSRRIFELGSAIGYSTIWLAKAAGPSAEVHYTDGDPENAERARRYFERAGVGERVHVHVGDALGELAHTSGYFDFIFNDVDKGGYLEVLDAVPSRLKPGGLFVTDNTLWRSRVVAPDDETSRTIAEFNKLLFVSNNFWSCLLPLRDGVTLSWRLP